MTRRSIARDVVGIAALALAYFAGARLGLRFVDLGPQVSAVWPPSGIALAAILLGGYRLWPGIVLGEFASSLVAGLALPAVVLLAADNTAKVLLAVWLLKRFVGFRNSMERVRDVIGLAVVGALLTTAAGAALGVACHMVFSGLAPAAAAGFWFTWWLADATGVLLLTPAILTWANWRTGGVSVRRLAEGGALAVTLVVITLLVFTGRLHQPYLIAPVLVWAALRFGQRGTATAIVLVSSLGIAMTSKGMGPFVLAEPTPSLLSLQAFLGVVAVTAMLLSAILAERQAAREALERALAEVESRVQKRTGELESANAALQLAQTQWSQFLDASPDVMWIKDADGRYVAVNDVFLRFWGKQRDQLVGKTDDGLGTRELAAVRASDAAAIHDGSYEGEFSERQAGQESVFHVKKVRLHDAEGRVVGTLGLARDVTDRRRAEQALQREKAFTDAVVDSLPGIFYVLDIQGRFVRWNKVAENLSGFKAAKLYRKRALFMIPRKNRPLVERKIREVFETGQAETEATVVDLEGAARVFLLTGTRAVIGGETYLVGHAIEITERKRMEEHLLQAQKMDAVGNLAGGVAHDFNNLLQAMLSLTQLIRLDQPDEKRRLARLAELEDHIKRGSRLTRQLLLFSRQDAVRPESLDLNEAVLEAEVLLHRLLRENIALEIELTAGRLPIEFDRHQLNQVIMNLAVNASDAMPEGGQLTLRTAAMGDSWVLLTVEDTGHGISDEIRERVFEPFFTTKGAGKGTGLGLSVVHGIVTRHGGTVEIESRAGAGAVFSIKLPRAANVAGEKPGDEPPAGAFETGRGERILVVEDEEAAREGLKEILGMLGYEVVAVGSGEEAGLLPARPGFDLLLTDLMLPGISGMDLRSGLRDRWPELAVILMSGYPQDEALRDQVHSGEVRFLQKPFGIAPLARELHSALADRPSQPA